MIDREDIGGVEPLARGLKVRCPTVSGLNAPGPLAIGWRRQAASLMFVMMAGSPARYRTAVFRLSAGCSAIELREKVDGARSRTRTWECRCVGPMPWPLGEASDHWCTREDLNLHAAGAAASEASASAVSPRVRCRVFGAGLRTLTSRLSLTRRALCPMS